VYKARYTPTGTIVAVKIISLAKEAGEKERENLKYVFGMIFSLLHLTNRYNILLCISFKLSCCLTALQERERDPEDSKRPTHRTLLGLLHQQRRPLGPSPLSRPLLLCIPTSGLIIATADAASASHRTHIASADSDGLLRGWVARGRHPPSTDQMPHRRRTLGRHDQCRQGTDRLACACIFLFACSCSSQGLAYLHRRGVIHRDLKAANILINDKGEPKIGRAPLHLFLCWDIHVQFIFLIPAADFGVSAHINSLTHSRNTVRHLSLLLALLTRVSDALHSYD
jgi:hypothetical protein